MLFFILRSASCSRLTTYYVLVFPLECSMTTSTSSLLHCPLSPSLSLPPHLTLCTFQLGLLVHRFLSLWSLCVICCSHFFSLFPRQKARQRQIVSLRVSTRETERERCVGEQPAMHINLMELSGELCEGNREKVRKTNQLRGHTHMDTRTDT